MKKIITASVLAVLALTMLLPVVGQVNAASVNHSMLRQGVPMPPGSGSGGGHIMLRQGVPMPPGSGSGGGHIMLRQGVPMPPGSGSGGGH
jgi:hypothetical protein